MDVAADDICLEHTTDISRRTEQAHLLEELRYLKNTSRQTRPEHLLWARPHGRHTFFLRQPPVSLHREQVLGPKLSLKA